MLQMCNFLDWKSFLTGLFNFKFLKQFVSWKVSPPFILARVWLSIFSEWFSSFCPANRKPRFTLTLTVIGFLQNPELPLQTAECPPTHLFISLFSLEKFLQNNVPWPFNSSGQVQQLRDEAPTGRRTFTIHKRQISTAGLWLNGKRQEPRSVAW